MRLSVVCHGCHMTEVFPSQSQRITDYTLMLFCLYNQRPAASCKRCSFRFRADDTSVFPILHAHKRHSRHTVDRERERERKREREGGREGGRERARAALVIPLAIQPPAPPTHTRQYLSHRPPHATHTRDSCGATRRFEHESGHADFVDFFLAASALV